MGGNDQHVALADGSPLQHDQLPVASQQQQLGAAMSQPGPHQFYQDMPPDAAAPVPTAIADGSHHKRCKLEGLLGPCVTSGPPAAAHGQQQQHVAMESDLRLPSLAIPQAATTQAVTTAPIGAPPGNFFIASHHPPRGRRHKLAAKDEDISSRQGSLRVLGSASLGGATKGVSAELLAGLSSGPAAAELQGNADDLPRLSRLLGGEQEAGQTPKPPETEDATTAQGSGSPPSQPHLPPSLQHSSLMGLFSTAVAGPALLPLCGEDLAALQPRSGNSPGAAAVNLQSLGALPSAAAVANAGGGRLPGSDGASPPQQYGPGYSNGVGLGTTATGAPSVQGPGAGGSGTPPGSGSRAMGASNNSDSNSGGANASLQQAAAMAAFALPPSGAGSHLPAAWPPLSLHQVLASASPAAAVGQLPLVGSATPGAAALPAAVARPALVVSLPASTAGAGGPLLPVAPVLGHNAGPPRAPEPVTPAEASMTSAAARLQQLQQHEAATLTPSAVAPAAERACGDGSVSPTPPSPKPEQPDALRAGPTPAGITKVSALPGSELQQQLQAAIKLSATVPVAAAWLGAQQTAVVLPGQQGSGQQGSGAGSGSGQTAADVQGSVPTSGGGCPPDNNGGSNGGSGGHGSGGSGGMGSNGLGASNTAAALGSGAMGSGSGGVGSGSGGAGSGGVGSGTAVAGSGAAAGNVAAAAGAAETSVAQPTARHEQAGQPQTGQRQHGAATAAGTGVSAGCGKGVGNSRELKPKPAAGDARAGAVPAPSGAVPAPAGGQMALQEVPLPAAMAAAAAALGVLQVAQEALVGPPRVQVVQMGLVALAQQVAQ
eukprot:gene4361-4614_t